VYVQINREMAKGLDNEPGGYTGEEQCRAGGQSPLKRGGNGWGWGFSILILTIRAKIKRGTSINKGHVNYGGGCHKRVLAKSRESEKETL